MACCEKQKIFEVGDIALDSADVAYCPEHGHSTSCCICDPENTTTETCSYHKKNGDCTCGSTFCENCYIKYIYTKEEA